MALPVEQQIVQLIEKHSNILVCLPANPTTDAISSGLGMYSLIQKLGKQAKIISDDFTLPTNHQFLDKSEEITRQLPEQKLVISVDIANTQVKDLTYDIQGDKMHIFVTPNQGELHQGHVTTSSNGQAVDLIIVLDSRDLNSLGKIFEDNAEFFHHTPIVAIDHHPANEHYGQINIVNVTATSVSEIVFELLQHMGNHLLDEHIATHLLTGIISKTKSFKTNSVTPRTLAIASHLIKSGARRDDIVKHLYQTKSLQSLKLWGKTLSDLQADLDHKIVWSVLKREDFTDTQSSPLDLEQVIDELIVNTPDAENIYVVYEQPDQQDHMTINAIISAAPYINAVEEFKDWGARGTNNFVYVSVPHSSLQMAQTMVHDRLLSLIK